MAVVTSVLLWWKTRGLYAKVIEVTKAERARRGLQVWLLLVPQSLAFQMMLDLDGVCVRILSS